MILNCLKCGSHFEAVVPPEDSEDPTAGRVCPECIAWQAVLDTALGHRAAARTIVKPSHVRKGSR